MQQQPPEAEISTSNILKDTTSEINSDYSAVASKELQQHLDQMMEKMKLMFNLTIEKKIGASKAEIKGSINMDVSASLKTAQGTIEEDIKNKISEDISSTMKSLLKPVQDSVKSADKTIADLKLEKQQLEANQKLCEYKPPSLSSKKTHIHMQTVATEDLREIELHCHDQIR